jgi:hypothetical protein
LSLGFYDLVNFKKKFFLPFVYGLSDYFYFIQKKIFCLAPAFKTPVDKGKRKRLKRKEKKIESASYKKESETLSVKRNREPKKETLTKALEIKGSLKAHAKTFRLVTFLTRSFKGKLITSRR